MSNNNYYQMLNNMFMKQNISQYTSRLADKLETDEKLKTICSNFIEEYNLDWIEMFTYIQLRKEENAYNMIHSKAFDVKLAIERCANSSGVINFFGRNTYYYANQTNKKKMDEQYFWSRMPQKPVYSGIWALYGFDILKTGSGLVRQTYNLFVNNVKKIDNYISDYNVKMIRLRNNFINIDSYAELDSYGRKLPQIDNRSSYGGLPFNKLLSNEYNDYLRFIDYDKVHNYWYKELIAFVDSIITAGYIKNDILDKAIFSLYLVAIKRNQIMSYRNTSYISELSKLSVDEYINRHSAEDKEKIANDLAMLNLKDDEIFFIIKSGYMDYVNEYIPKLQQLRMLESLENKHSNQNRPLDINEIDLMSGRDFEQLVADILNHMGYEARVTKVTGDQGLDIIAIKGTFRLGVQTKRWSGNVGNKAIQETVAGKAYYNVDKVLVVTNSYFTNEAVALAEANGVMLWDRRDLEEKIKSL